MNAAASPVEFLSDDRSMLDAYKDTRKNGLEFLAIYHSHPTSVPVPSKTDLEMTWWPGVVSLIVSLATTPPTVRGWWLTDVDYREAEWDIV